MKNFTLKYIKPTNILFILLLLLFGLNLNKIVLRIFLPSVSTIPKKCDIGKNSYSLIKNSNGRFWIDQNVSTSGLFRTHIIVGWAFLETSIENNNKNIELLFKKQNENTFYKISTKPYEKAGAYQTFYKTTRVRGINHGFLANFSIITMPDGIYKMFIYDRENSQDQGLIDSRYFFEKERNDLIHLKNSFPSSKVFLNDPDIAVAITKKIEYHIDKVQLQGSFVRFSGWGFHTAETTRTFPILLHITKNDGSVQIYDSTCIDRPDVGKHFNNNVYTYSGFIADIPSSAFSPRENVITIITGKDKMLSNVSYSLDLVNNTAHFTKIIK